MRRKELYVLLGLVLAMGCQPKEKKSAEYSELLPKREHFRDTIDGKPTDLFYLMNHHGMQAAITNYGGRVVSLIVPDKRGLPVDVVLGIESLSGYQNSTEAYFGALIGRVGNRIANGRFSVDGKEYQIPQNNGPNTLHGGLKGFHGVVWDAEQTSDSSLVLNYFSPDGEEGFPGNLEVRVVYSLTADNGLKIEYHAQTDQLTPVNLTNHAFFNLNGEGSGTINNHVLMVDADFITPVDQELIPFGELLSVEGTPFDFRTPVEIGARLDTTAHIQLSHGKGYDHNFVLNKSNSELTLVAKITGDKSGIVMSVYTQEPGLQFYGGNFMQSQNTLKSGAKDDFRTSFCLETQHFPDAPNQPSFPSILFGSGEVYQTVSEYRFGVISEL